MFLSTFLVLAFPVLVVAQYGPTTSVSPTSSTSSTVSSASPSATANTPGQIKVNVGSGNSLTFNPANITAPIGTVVTFIFPSTGITHSVTQSSFVAPCTYLAASGGNPGGFDSGLTVGTQFSINITNDAVPIWYHCKQVFHCGMGMVGSINAPSTGNTFQAFQAAALKIGNSETAEKDNGPVTGGVGAIATATPTSPTTSTSASASPTSSGKSGAGRIISNGAWGVVVAAFAMVIA